MQDADENEDPISGTRRTARQKPAVSQLRPEKNDRQYKSDKGTKSYKHVMSGAKHTAVTEKEIKLERRRSSASSKSPQKPPNRPPSAHANRAYPKVAIPTDHPSYFGVSTPTIRAPPVVSQYPMMSQPIPLRPRAITSQTYPLRPVSFHASYANGSTYNAGPPVSTSSYYQQPQLMAPSFPPPSPSSSYMRYAATPQPEHFQPQPMLGGRPLSSRFDPVPSRTASAFGMRDAPQHNPVHRQFQIEDSYDPGYASASESTSVTRRPSIRAPIVRPSLRTKASDYEAMPPPARPTGILRNKTTDYYPELPDPPRERRESRTVYREEQSPARHQSTRRNSAAYDRTPEEPSSSRHQSTHRNSMAYDRTPEEPSSSRHQSTHRNSVAYDRTPEEPSSSRHQSAHRNSVAYDRTPEELSSSRHQSTHKNSVSYDRTPETHPVRVETANTSHRRQSYYSQSASLNSSSGTGSPWEEQAKAAQSYQADVGASAPLTSEMLKRQQRRQAGSSRSTKSSGSHDESDYRRSATTRTTRSGSGQEQGNDDGFTIKVKGGQARIMVDGAQIDCTEGGEVQVQRQKSLRNGSERSSSVYGASQIDDRERRSRVDRKPGRSRMSSHGGESYHRMSPEYHTGVDYTREWV